MTVLRARAAEEKEGRRRQLRAAAAARLDQAGYAATTMAEIARRAGVAKGTTYLYYRSKEDLFLELLLGSLAEWRDVALHELSVQPAAAPESDAALLARTLADRPRLVRLLALRHPVLEQGATEAAVVRFRSRMVDLLAPLASTLEARRRDLFAGDGTGLLRRLLALAAGLADLLAGEAGSSSRSAAAAAPARPFEAELAACLTALDRNRSRGDGAARTG